MQLNDVLKKIWKAIQGANSLTINVEKPLNSGVKFTAVADTGDGGHRILLPGALDFARALDCYETDKPWNRMEIIMRPRNSIKVTTSFDQDLYQQTLERIK